MSMDKVALTVDPEFQGKIPPLTDDEYRQLEENILTAGEVYEPIVVWNGIIVDGHNRYKIICSHPEIKWHIREMQFADKWEAFDWMYKNQLGRRNLTDEQRTYLLGKLYEARKQAHGGDRKSSDQIGHLIHGRIKEKIAEEQGVGQGTVQRAEHFAKGIDAIREQEPELAENILTAKKKVNKTDVAKLAKAKEEDRPNIIAELKRNKPRVVKTKEEREEDKKLSERLSENVNRMRSGGKVEATADDLISMVQDLADASLASLKSILGTHIDIVNENKKDISERIIKIFNETVDKIKEIM